MKIVIARAPDVRARKLKPNGAMTKRERIPQLVDGAHLGAEEFLRRYEAMPEVKKAELIDGVVYLMTSPVSVEKHAKPDALVQFWLGYYALCTPGVEPASNPTV